MMISDVVYWVQDAWPELPPCLSSMKQSEPNSMLVLASASPRRQELLRNAGIPFQVYPANVPEIQRPGEAPREFAMRLAREKACEVWQRLGDRDREAAPKLVLGADTIVVVDNLVLGKPQNPEDAIRMLRLLSGRGHEVLTAVCLIGGMPGSRDCPQVFEDVRTETTKVFFDPVPEEELRAYVAQDEPMDKAGAYAIQGTASRWIRRVEGDYPNVVGLPVRLVCQMLREHGVAI
jgi:septum formation protein